MKPILEILSPGFMATLQGRQRVKLRQFGVPVSGPLDRYSCNRANYLVENPADALAIEIVQGEASFLFLDYGKMAISGALGSVQLNKIPLAADESVFFAPGDVLKIDKFRIGHIAYLAVQGGFTGQEILGSSSTYLRAGWGGLDGRTLRRKDLLYKSTDAQLAYEKGPVRSSLFSDIIRIIPGPEAHFINLKDLANGSWSVSTASDRSGFRLEGKPLSFNEHIEMKSCPIDIGTIQLPRSGTPIVIMNDGAAIGGYARIANVIKVDVPVLAQKRFREPFRFECITISEANQIWLEEGYS